jgi:ABC-type transport system involved in multi-copper enzyme maturation permease subunit
VTWLAWRQLRTQALIAAALLAVLVVVLALTGPNLLHYADTFVNGCAAHHDCSAVTSNFHALAHLANAYSLLVLLVPVLLGIFWGAPLIARELESGTFRLAWTQSVTRVRWIATRLALVTLAALVLTALLSLAVTWWQSPVDRLNQALFHNFDERDLMPAAYAAFAVTLGALVGALVKRTLAAMALTIGGFLFVDNLKHTY